MLGQTDAVAGAVEVRIAVAGLGNDVAGDRVDVLGGNPRLNRLDGLLLGCLLYTSPSPRDS